MAVNAKRLLNVPIIHPHMGARIGDNINNPSIIRVPKWVKNPLGHYYLYFSDHKGQYIRMAYADDGWALGRCMCRVWQILCLSLSTHQNHHEVRAPLGPHHWKGAIFMPILRHQMYMWMMKAIKFVCIIMGFWQMVTNRRVLLDPCVFEEGGKTYLLYCGAAESGGIGVAELQF